MVKFFDSQPRVTNPFPSPHLSSKIWLVHSDYIFSWNYWYFSDGSAFKKFFHPVCTRSTKEYMQLQNKCTLVFRYRSCRMTFFWRKCTTRPFSNDLGHLNNFFWSISSSEIKIYSVQISLLITAKKCFWKSKAVIETFLCHFRHFWLPV